MIESKHKQSINPNNLARVKIPSDAIWEIIDIQTPKRVRFFLRVSYFYWFLTIQTQKYCLKRVEYFLNSLHEKED